jgi:NADH dehydrogenase [ubiquinone] 1 alpha subcomplex assembly factor 3
MLIFGTGESVVPPPKEIREYISGLGIQLDVQSSVRRVIGPSGREADLSEKRIGHVQHASRGGTEGRAGFMSHHAHRATDRQGPGVVLTHAASPMYSCIYSLPSPYACVPICASSLSR